MPAITALQLPLRRERGKKLVNRITVANFHDALRVVQDALASSVVPVELARLYADAARLVMVPLLDS